MSETVRFDFYCGPPIDLGKMPPVVTIAGYPPLKGEGARDYHRRIQAQIMSEIYAPKPTLAQRLARLFGGTR